MRPNDTKRYEQEFPFISPCGRERNYIRCDDCPIVFTHVIQGEKLDLLSYGSTLHNALTVNFEPEKVCMLPSTGRIYHPAPENGGGIGLLRSTLAIEWSKYFIFGENDSDPPRQFEWNNKLYNLTNELVEAVNKD